MVCWTNYADLGKISTLEKKKIYPYCDTPALTKSKLGVSKCELETLSCVIYLSRPTTRFKLVAISLINFSNLDATAYRFFSVYIIGDLIRSHAHYIDNDKSAATGRYQPSYYRSKYASKNFPKIFRETAKIISARRRIRRTLK